MEPTLGEFSNYREWLGNQLIERKRRLPLYSLRSFARKLGLSPSTVSGVIAGKRPLSQRAAMKIADRLQLDPRDRRELLKATLNEKLRVFDDGKKTKQEEVQKIDLDTFKVISEWHHYALLNLLLIDGVKPTEAAMAERLGISLRDCEQALLRLRRLGMVERTPQGYKRTCTRLETPTEIASAPLRKFYRQILKKAQDSLELDPLDDRDFGSITMAINPLNLPRAKELLRKVRQDLSDLLEVGGRKRVYILQTQLFPLDRKNGPKK